MWSNPCRDAFTDFVTFLICTNLTCALALICRNNMMFAGKVVQCCLFPPDTQCKIRLVAKDQSLLPNQPLARKKSYNRPDRGNNSNKEVNNRHRQKGEVLIYFLILVKRDRRSFHFTSQIQTSWKESLISELYCWLLMCWLLSGNH